MQDRKQPVARRAMLGGVAAVGTLAAAATLLPGQPQVDAKVAAADAKPALDTSGGYQLTDHVKQYYKTARI